MKRAVIAAALIGLAASSLVAGGRGTVTGAKSKRARRKSSPAAAS